MPFTLGAIILFTLGSMAKAILIIINKLGRELVRRSQKGSMRILLYFGSGCQWGCASIGRERSVMGPCVAP